MNTANTSLLNSSPRTDVIILGHCKSDQDRAFTSETPHELLPQSLQLIEKACAQLSYSRNYFALGEHISNHQLNARIVLFFTSHLPTHQLYAQIGALLQSYPKSLVVPIVEYADQAKAAALLDLGCVDFLLAPFGQNQCVNLLQRLNCDQASSTFYVNESQASRRLLSMAQRVATTRAPILITGETGTGKELLARYIHEVGGNSRAPFIAINCAAIPEAMLESLLFGHEKGAFTGAVQASPGKFELAQGGTLLLDEIGEMPLGLQAKLLRVLQEKKVERLGGRREIDLDVRIIAATNRDLREEVAQGRFRSDLLFRLDVLPLHISPLRERMDDVIALAETFINKFSPAEAGCNLLTEEARLALRHHDWPGNVRELENLMQRALVLRKGLFIQPDDLGLPLPNASSCPTDDTLPPIEARPFVHKNAQEAQVHPSLIQENALSNGDKNASQQDWAHAIELGEFSSTSLTRSTQSGEQLEPLRALSFNEEASRQTIHITAVNGKSALKAKGKLAEYQHVINTIQFYGGHKTKAAQHLGMTTRALRYRLNAMREQGITLPF